jgi:hypothetical protein
MTRKRKRWRSRSLPAPEGTRVVLTHSGWEKLSANAQQARDSYNQGWEGVFVTAYPEYIQS